MSISHGKANGAGTPCGRIRAACDVRSRLRLGAKVLGTQGGHRFPKRNRWCFSVIPGDPISEAWPGAMDMAILGGFMLVIDTCSGIPLWIKEVGHAETELAQENPQNIKTIYIYICIHIFGWWFGTFFIFPYIYIYIGNNHHI